MPETASTFAEAVLGEQRLIETTSPGEKLSILDNMLSHAVVFLMTNPYVTGAVLEVSGGEPLVSPGSAS